MKTDELFLTIAKGISENYKPGNSEETTISLFENLVRYTYQNHPGIFTLKEVEKSLEIINNKWFGEDPLNLPAKNRSPEKVIHIITTMYYTGGHSRVIENWIKTDKTRSHSLVIVRPSDYHKEELNSQIKSNGGTIYKLNEPSYYHKAERIRSIIAEEKGDLLILHTHPEEIVTFTAIADLDISKIIFNHADHAFWVGASFADGTINIRDAAAAINKTSRGVLNNYLLPITVRKNQLELSQFEAKKQLNIKADTTLIISIGSPNKFRQSKDKSLYSFGNLVKKLNSSIENIEFIIVGPNESHRQQLELDHVENVRLAGLVNDPFLIYNAADFIIDPIPMGSYTAVLEAASCGAYPLLFSSGIQLFDLSNDPALNANDIISTNNFDEIVKQVTFLTSHPEILNELRNELITEVQKYHSEESFESYLKLFYDQLREEQQVKVDDTLVDLQLGPKLRLLTELNQHSLEKLMIELMENKTYFNFKTRFLIGKEIMKKSHSRELINSFKFTVRFLMP